MKKRLLTITCLTIIGISTNALFADNSVTIPAVPLISSVGVAKESDDIVTLPQYRNVKKQRVDSLVKERITSLSVNLKAIEGDKLLTTEQKTSFATRINATITGLQALRDSASSTDATTTREIARKVINDYRIYGVFLPQIRTEKRIYDLQSHAATLTERFAKIQESIDDYKGKGRDVTVWQKNLDDAKLVVASDTMRLSALLTKVVALKPSDYGTTTKETIEFANQELKSIQKDFLKLRNTIHKPKQLALIPKNKQKEHNDRVSSILTKTSWVWVSSTIANTTTQAPNGEKFVLSFGEDNRVSSKTDCNGVGGSYTVGANNTLTFGPFMSTMMFCEGSKEQEYSSSLMKTTSFSITDKVLTLTNASGTMMFIKK